MMKKNIIVEDGRQIMALGGLRGPAGPFLTDTKTIFRLISEGCKVKEVLKNGQEVKLTYSNFDRDLNEELGINKEVKIKNKVEPVKPTVVFEPDSPEEIKKPSPTSNNVIEEETNAVKTAIIDVCEEV